MSFDPGPIVVVKLGGSLLDWPEWPDRVTRYLATLAGKSVVLIVGGGRFADALRDLDRIHALGDARAHELAHHVLDLTAQFAAALLPGGDVVDCWDAMVFDWMIGKIPIFAPRLFFQWDDEQPDALPRTWATTTDSIAARLAHRFGAAELVLLKSCPLPPDCPDWPAAARLGLVDPEFPRAIRAVPNVSLICLKGVGG